MLENDECGLDDMQRESAMRMLDYYMDGTSHFTELSARGCISQMYYYEDDTKKVFAPYFDYEEIKEKYENVKDLIPDYNAWDYAVTMNLIYSNHQEVIKKWTRDKDKVIGRVSELSVSFLNDEDSNHPNDKIWWFMSGC